MPPTEIRGKQIKDGSVKRPDLNILEVGFAVIRKIIAGTGITLNSTGADEGTGDVTVAVADISVRVFTTAGQSISSSSWNTVNWASESYDTQTMHDNVTNNSRITIPTGEGGKYLITASVGFTIDGIGNRGIRIRKNGVGQERRVLFANAGVGLFVNVTVSDILDLVAGDFLEIMAWQSSGVSLNLLTGADRNHFAVIKLA